MPAFSSAVHVFAKASSRASDRHCSVDITRGSPSTFSWRFGTRYGRDIGNVRRHLPRAGPSQNLRTHRRKYTRHACHYLGRPDFVHDDLQRLEGWLWKIGKSPFAGGLMSPETQELLRDALFRITIAFAVLFSGYLMWLRCRSCFPFSHRTSFLIVFAVVISLFVSLDYVD